MSIEVNAVLFTVDAESRPARALRWAADLALSLGVELHVLCVLKDLLSGNRLRGNREFVKAMASADRVIATCQDLRDWCCTILGNGWSDERLHVRMGPCAHEIARKAEDLGMPLVAIPSEMPGGGRAASVLLRGTNFPVLLVARRALGRTSIVVATDLEDDRLPVLRFGVDLARRVEARLLLVHNVPPVLLPGAFLGPVPSIAPPRTDALGAVRERLRAISRDLEPASSSLISTRVSASEAILEAAESVDANLVVVGTRRRSWLDQLLRGRASVANRLLSDSRRSVLVLPVGNRSGRELQAS